jgi:ubiquinone/menaquinone biosynthesis C-methylase UbiE
MSANLYDLLSDSIPNDHCKQTSGAQIMRAQVEKGFRPAEVLDFGCGDGRTIDFFRNLLPETRWTGIDIASSPEVNERRRTDGEFITYDGYEFPLPDSSYELIYSYQVLEHVHKPDVAFREIARVLKPGGLFVGQTSQFEPYHSFSMWNFTVYGFKRLVEDAGLILTELRPSIDGFTMMERTYKGRPPEYSKYFSSESPKNVEIETNARRQLKGRRIINYRKLVFCGQFSFVCQRPKE